MNSDNYGHAGRPETLDADAVCAQCNTVNAEGTLLCKVCGNNLRDQRNIRLTADQALDLERGGQRRRTWMSGILFLLAIGLILATLINQDLIVAWLIQPPGAAHETAELWQGEYDIRFETMAGELSAANVTEEQARAVMAAPSAAPSMDGIYALFAGDYFAGVANVQFEGDEFYFVGVLADGEEVRGKAVSQGNFYTAPPELTSIRIRGRASEARGVAMPQGGGVVDCIGDFGNTQVSFVAYQMPAP